MLKVSYTGRINRVRKDKTLANSDSGGVPKTEYDILNQTAQEQMHLYLQLKSENMELEQMLSKVAEVRVTPERFSPYNIVQFKISQLVSPEISIGILCHEIEKILKRK